MPREKQPVRKTSDSDHPAADAPAMSDGVRTLISMALIVHLTAILLAVSSEFGPTSDLRENLADAPVLSQYMKTLHQHTAYNYHLTYGGDLDVDHFAELTLEPSSDDSTGDENDEEVLPLFDPAETPFFSRTRYRNLALNMARRSGDDETAGVLPRAVSAKLLSEHGIESGAHMFRLKRLLLLDIDDYASLDEARHDPYAPELYQTFYSANVFDYNNQWRLNKAVAAGQTAPVRSLAPKKSRDDQDAPEKSLTAPLKKES